METRKIGSLDVSVVGLGANNFGMRIDEKRSGETLHAALDAGVNFIDTADIYGGSKSEEFIGTALKGRRDEAILATKFGMKTGEDFPGGATPAYMRSSIESSLRRLQTDRVDLYILHRPDPNTPIGETLAAFNDLIAEGKVIEIGCSGFSADQLKEAEAAVGDGAKGFVNLQNQFNLLQRGAEKGVLEECVREGVGFVPFSPLANGLLTGKYRRGAALPEGARITGMAEERRTAVLDANLDTVEQLQSFCEARNHTMLELTMSWLLTRPSVASVIAGATSPAQVEANAVATGWKLSDEDLAAIDEIAPIG